MRYAALFVAGLTAHPAGAGELVELQGGNMDLGSFRGVVYYTSAAAGYRVVTTLASHTEGPPIRFVATLADGQLVEISVPGGLGEAATVIRISRIKGKLFVSDADDPQETADVAH